MSGVKSWFTKLVSLYEETDHRSHVRLPADFKATLNGAFGSIYVTGVNATRNGTGVQSPDPLLVGTLVFIRISTLGLMGFGHVRHCSKRGNGYLLGIRFREALARDRDAMDDFTYERVRLEVARVWDEPDAS